MQERNPYSAFEEVNSKDPQASFTQKTRELAPYYRANFLEILFNSVKGTIIRAMQLAINGTTQAAYSAQLAKESISPAVSQYLKVFPLYSVALVSLTFYDVIARIWRTNIFAKSIDRIIDSTPTAFPSPKNATEWCQGELEKLERGSANNDAIARNIFHVLQYTNVSLEGDQDKKTIYQNSIKDQFQSLAANTKSKDDLLDELKEAYKKPNWHDIVQHASECMAYTGESITETDLDADIFKAYTQRRSSIERQLTANQSPGRLMDIPKTYYNITQNIVMFPIEIGMYSLTLGWQILAVMLALSLCIGGFNIWLSNRKENKKAQADKHRDTVRTDERFLGKEPSESYKNAIKANNKTALSIKMIDIHMDMVERLFFNIFTLVLMGLCAHFLFMGQYDLAMVMAQTTSATIAFTRITKYLSLYKNHNALKRTMDVYSTYSAYQEGPCPKKVPEAKPEAPWGFDETIGFYICAVTISLGLLLLPLPQIVLPTITNLDMAIKIGVSTWLGLAIWFKNTNESNVDASLMATVVKTLGLALTGYYLLQATAIHQALVVLCHNSANIAAAYGSLSVLGISLFEYFLRKPSISVLTQIGTWASQDIISVCKLPVYASNYCVASISSLFTEKTKTA